jgi:hypothetical protein
MYGSYKSIHIPQARYCIVRPFNLQLMLCPHRQFFCPVLMIIGKIGNLYRFLVHQILQR